MPKSIKFQWRSKENHGWVSSGGYFTTGGAPSQAGGGGEGGFLLWRREEGGGNLYAPSALARHPSQIDWVNLCVNKLSRLIHFISLLAGGRGGGTSTHLLHWHDRPVNLCVNKLAQFMYQLFVTYMNWFISELLLFRGAYFFIYLFTISGTQMCSTYESFPE